MIRVLVADRQPISRDGLRALLDAQPDFTVVAAAASAAEAIELSATLFPDILILEMEPRRSGLDAVETLTASTPALRTVLTTPGIARSEMIAALRAGARGVFMKDADTPLLFKCIRAVMRGEYWIGRESVADLVALVAELHQENGQPRKITFGLTGRELQILSAVVEGYTNREIAEQFAISSDTVKHHVSKVFSKVGVSKRVDLAVAVLNQQLAATGIVASRA